MELREAIRRNILYPAQKIVLGTNRVLNNYQEVVWLIGDGRSGTTWVSDLINNDGRYREMFEPFHPELIADMDFLIPHHYARTKSSDKHLEEVAFQVFTGRFTDYRVDFHAVNRSLSYKGLLIKDIFANLFSYWVSQRFPNLKIVLLIRNPFAVALSKRKHKTWFWATNPLDLLKQDSLYQDYLHPFEEIIRETSRKESFILNQILIWSIIHYVPLHQFSRENIHVSFYEDLLMDPNQEVSEILAFINKNKMSGTHTNIAQESIHTPSRFSKEFNASSKISHISSWENQLSREEIDAGMRILEHFGLGDLYDKHSMPNRDSLNKIMTPGSS